MKIQSMGDLSRALASQKQVNDAQLRQSSLMAELASGKRSDQVGALSGDVSQLSDVVRIQSLNESYVQNAAELTVLASGAQRAIATVFEATETLIESLAINTEASSAPALEAASNQARSTASTVLAALNVDVAGRYLFSGSSINQEAMVDVDTFLTEIENVAAGSNNSSEIIAAVSQFFEPGGSFEATIYRGATSDIQMLSLGASESVDLAVRADDVQIRKTLEAAALAYLVSNSPANLSMQDKTQLLSASRGGALQAKDGLIGIQAQIGLSEQRIEEFSVRSKAAIFAAEQLRANLVGVDQFKTAARLEDVNQSLELIFAVTARAARLSFLEFMR